MVEIKSFQLFDEQAAALIITVDPEATAARGRNLTPAGCAQCGLIYECDPRLWHRGSPNRFVNPRGKHMGEEVCAIRELVNPLSS